MVNILPEDFFRYIGKCFVAIRPSNWFLMIVDITPLNEWPQGGLVNVTMLYPNGEIIEDNRVTRFLRKRVLLNGEGSCEP